MPQPKAMKGYVKTSNIYFAALISVSIGFFAGVLFSAYKTLNIPIPTQANRSGHTHTAPRQLSEQQMQTLRALLDATRSNPNDIDGWTRLGHFYFNISNYEKAIEAYQKSLALAPDRPDVWTDMGVMYRRAGKPKKAIESFDRALSISTDHQKAMFNKGVVYMHDLNDTGAALASWEMLLKINPDAKTPGGQLVRTMVNEIKRNNRS